MKSTFESLTRNHDLEMKQVYWFNLNVDYKGKGYPSILNRMMIHLNKSNIILCIYFTPTEMTCFK
jgi:hypothetical protein